MPENFYNYYTHGNVFEEGDRVQLLPVSYMDINEEIEEYIGIQGTVVKGNYQREPRHIGDRRLQDESWYIDVEWDEPDDTRFPVHQYYPKRFMKLNAQPTWEV